MTQILSLNQRVSQLNKARQAAEASLAAAIASVVLAPTVPALEKARQAVKALQKLLILRQKHLLAQSLLIKEKVLKNSNKNLKAFKSIMLGKQAFIKKLWHLKKKKLEKMPIFINRWRILKVIRK